MARPPLVGAHCPRSLGEFQAWFRTDGDCLPYGPVTDPCGNDPSVLYASGPAHAWIKPFDAEPAFRVDTAVTLTFAISP